MKLHKLISSALISALMFVAVPARAGVPVYDAAAFFNALAQIQSWSKQATDMVNQLNQLQAQFTQLQTMTTKLDGIRNLGSILNDPSILAALPPEMQNSTHLLLNPAALASSAEHLNQILTSFGVNRTLNFTAGQAQADTIGRMQQILAATQARSTQLAQLAGRVDTTPDAKASIDMVNRNVLEAASINNQMVQTMAALESARQAVELKRIADNQAFFKNVKTGGAAPLKTYTY